VPAKLVELMYQRRFALADRRGYYIVATIPNILGSNERQIVKGSSFIHEGAVARTLSGNPPAPVQQIFQSFEFVKD
jgi:hypothetical protein